MKLRLAFMSAGAVIALAACNSGSGTSSVPLSNSRAVAQSLSTNVRTVCPAVSFEFMRCNSIVRTDTDPSKPTGYGPADLQAAYNLPSTGGAGQTVGIVDAYDDPNAESDLQVYRKQYNLPDCTTANGCFRKTNQLGEQKNYPRGDTGWGGEISLDVDMASAGCPKCNILLVEANDNGSKNLGLSVDEAVKLGASVVSNSYSGGGGNPADYNHPGVIILASSGDGGYGISNPASYNTVIAIGGTTLTKGGGSRGWTESVWSGTGSGCTTQPKPKWQHGKHCTNRVANDVSAVANPGTGVAVYDTYGAPGWQVYGGTSVSSPLIGAVYGLAGNAAKLTAAASLWDPKHHKFLYDVNSGANGTCTPKYLCNGEVGYDGPTGWGTPNGLGAF